MMKRLIALLILAAALTACASPRFGSVPYHNNEQNWATAQRGQDEQAGMAMGNRAPEGDLPGFPGPPK